MKRKGDKDAIYGYFYMGPDKRNDVLKRRMEGAMSPPEIKILKEWVDIQSGRSFRLIENDDPKAAMRATMAWADLGKLEIVPVMETEEVLKLAASGK
jgi:hypothetical protein